MPPNLPEEIWILILENLAFPGATEFGNAQDELDYKPKKAKGYRDGVLEGLKTLHDLCLVSKSLNRLAHPILYRGLATRRLRDESDLASDFLRTICIKPNYGLALRTLLAEPWGSLQTMDQTEVFDLLQGDVTVVALFQWRARGFWFGEDEGHIAPPGDGDDNDADQEGEDDDDFSDFLTVRSLCKSLSLGLADAHVAMILLMCPNIRELDIRSTLGLDATTILKLLNTVLSREFQEKSLPHSLPDPEQEESDYLLANMFGAAWPEQKLQKPLILQHLQKLTISFSAITDARFSFLTKLISLPSLRSFTAYSLYTEMGDKADGLEGIKCPNLETMELVDCQVPSRDVVAFVKCCPNLRNLAVEWEWIADVSRIGRQSAEFALKYNDIGRAISDHAPQMERLTLRSPSGILEADERVWKHPHVLGGTLLRLPGLRHLELDEHSIYGSDYASYPFSLARTVPKSVVSLDLTSYDGGYSADINDVPVDVYQKWQDDDLNMFLQDDSFYSLGRVTLRCRKRTFDRDVAERHGWEMHQEEETEGLELVLVNRNRLGTRDPAS